MSLVSDEFGIRAWVVIAGIAAAIVLLIGVCCGLGYWNSRVTCDHWEHNLQLPTRLDVLGPGCVVQLPNGREIPVHQYYALNHEENREGE